MFKQPGKRFSEKIVAKVNFPLIYVFLFIICFSFVFSFVILVYLFVI